MLARGGRGRLRHRLSWGRVPVVVLAVALLASGCAGGVTHTTTPGTHPRPVRKLPPLRATVGPISDVSQACPGQNAEVEQAVDPKLGYVYELWIGCGGIGFSRSTDGGRSFSTAIGVPGSLNTPGPRISPVSSWDPAIAVAPDGTVYLSFMVQIGTAYVPVVDASFDHGLTFPQSVPLLPPPNGDFGDRDFIAVSPDGTIYVTWDYAPNGSLVKIACAKGGSCYYTAGDLNIVEQRSTDGGKTWGPIVPVTPGFPRGGADAAPLLVEPNGQVDVEYQGMTTGSSPPYALGLGHSYFTSSSDGGSTWSPPTILGPASLTMARNEWWIDGCIGTDTAGNLYATWDTQGTSGDIAWLTYSTDAGKTWSALKRVSTGTSNAPHIVEVVGGRAGIAYVGWLSDSSGNGYALYLRPFSITRGWLSAPIRVSTAYGDSAIWPGDTFGISARWTSSSAGPAPAFPVINLSWGSATGAGGSAYSEIFSTSVTFNQQLGG